MRGKIVGFLAGITVAVGTYDPCHQAEAQDGRGAAISDVAKQPAVPHVVGRAWSQEEDARRFPYRGLAVRSNLRLQGPTAEIQRDLIDLLTWDDDIPEARQAQFRWVGELGGVITGWDGEVIDLSPAERGYVATLKVYARQTTGAAVINGEIYERYRIVDGRLEFVDSYASVLPEVTTFN